MSGLNDESDAKSCRRASHDQGRTVLIQENECKPVYRTLEIRAKIKSVKITALYKFIDRLKLQLASGCAILTLSHTFTILSFFLTNMPIENVTDFFQLEEENEKLFAQNVRLEKEIGNAKWL